MKIFVTGATGFIGTAVVAELHRAGHEVTGLARTEAAAAALARAGAVALRGSLEDLESLRSGADASEGVIHLAYVHDFSKFEDNARVDRGAIQAMGDVLAGSDRPLVIAHGTPVAAGRAATEQDSADPSAAGGRALSEQLLFSFVERGVRASSVRLPRTVHGDGDHGFVPIIIRIARERGVSAYIGDGSTRWPAVHRDDAASLFRLAFEKARPGTVLHAVGDEGVAIRDIAEVIGRELDIPVVSISPDEAREHFGFLSAFLAVDAPASSVQTQEQMGWHPSRPGLIADLAAGDYFRVAQPAATR
jgi:nucleoside-diphosphate-sugar epimerase